jgi:molecular chaperone GrpE
MTETSSHNEDEVTIFNEPGIEEVTDNAEESTKIIVENPTILRLKKRISELQNDLHKVEVEAIECEQILKELDGKYASEIARIKQEFQDVKRRSLDEQSTMVNKARSEALKELLPVIDNFIRLKGIYNHFETDNEQKIFDAYGAIFDSLSNIIAEFGLEKYPTVGKVFDYNYMEAINTMPSTEYPENVVCLEYQMGYIMGEKCVRPALVVVSTGPGPSA